MEINRRWCAICRLTTRIVDAVPRDRQADVERWLGELANLTNENIEDNMHSSYAAGIEEGRKLQRAEDTEQIAAAHAAANQLLQQVEALTVTLVEDANGNPRPIH